MGPKVVLLVGTVLDIVALRPENKKKVPRSGFFWGERQPLPPGLELPSRCSKRVWSQRL